MANKQPDPAAPDQPKPSPLWAELDRYVGHLKLVRNLAQNSLLAYAADLQAFAKSFEKAGLMTFAQLDAGVLGLALAEQSQSGLSSRSLGRRVSALRGFLRYLVDEGKIRDDLERGLPRLRLGRRLPRALGEDEVIAMLKAPDLSQKKGRRDRALLSLAYAAGLRASELVGLTLGDLDLSQGTVSALGKGNKRRLVPLGELALADLGAYLMDRLSARVEPQRSRGPWLFLGARGKPLTRQAFWKIVKKYGFHAGTPRTVHPHMLRHSFASHLIQGGADLRSVQLLLGHESITTTEIYTHVSPEHVRRAYDRSHPRA